MSGPMRKPVTSRGGAIAHAMRRHISPEAKRILLYLENTFFIGDVLDAECLDCECDVRAFFVHTPPPSHSYIITLHRLYGHETGSLIEDFPIANHPSGTQRLRLACRLAELGITHDLCVVRSGMAHQWTYLPGLRQLKKD